MLKLAMLSTGEEVLHGDIDDTNASWLSSLLFEHGYGLTKRSTVGDNRASLYQELLMLTLNSDILFINGGLGPTTDDLTTEVAAEIAELELELYPEWLEKLATFFSSRQQPMPQSNIKQAMLPKGSTLIDNPIGTACGFRLVINDCVCYFTPGVPSEFKLMVSEHIIPDLKVSFPEIMGPDCHRIYTLGSSESELANRLDEMPLPDGYQLGYRSYIPFIEIKIFGPKGDVDNAIKVVTKIRDTVENWIVSIDEPMLDRLSHCLEQAQLSLSIAEQSTHGWLSYWLFSDESISLQRGSSWVLSPKVGGAMAGQDAMSAILALAAATRDKSATELALASGPCCDGEFSLALSTPDGEWAQVLKLNRQYSREDSQVVIGTIAADMLLRYLTEKNVFGVYRLAKEVKQIYLPHESIAK